MMPNSSSRMDVLAAGAGLAAPLWPARAVPTACCKAPGRARSTATEARAAGAGLGAGLGGATFMSRPVASAGDDTPGDGTAGGVTTDGVTADGVTEDGV